MKMMPPSQLQIEELSVWNIVVDLLLICISLTSCPMMANHATPFRRGFFCNDDTIRYPYKSSTVNDAYLYSFSTTFGVGTIAALELWSMWGDEGRRRRVALIAGRSVPEWAMRLLRHILLFGYGLGTQEVLINVGKFTVGRLRPHFLAVCKPNVVCNGTASDPIGYITDYECTGEKGFNLLQSRLSFPSGHSAMAFYAAVFVVLYMERRIHWPERFMVMKTAVQVIVVSLAWFTALSRLADHKHHWGDVTVGCLLGTLVAVFWVRRVNRVSKDETQSNGDSETTFVFPTDSPAAKP